MNRQKINMQVQDIVRSEKSSKGVVSMAGVLDQVGTVVDAVKVDSEYVKARIQKAIDSNLNSRNPLNGILTIFGLQLVRVSKSDDMKVSREGVRENELDSMLKIDERVFRSAVSEIASSLAEYEKEKKGNREDQVNKINELIDRADRQEQEIGQLKTDAKAQLQTTARWIQSMLGSLGPDKTDDKLYEQLGELMQFLDIEAFWNADDGPLRESAMFKEMKVGDISKYKAKPCLICDGEVLAQGVRFRQTGSGSE